MRQEIAAAVVFVKRLVQMHDNLTKDKVDEFSNCLSGILVSRFRGHWYADKPFKGQGYRCIRINRCEPKDDVLDQAARECGLEFWDLNMPSEMTLWVDPAEVYCRYVEQQAAVFAAIIELKKKLKDLVTLSDVDISNIEQVLCILKPIKTVTTMMCSETHPTVSLIHPLKEMLLQHLDQSNSPDDNTLITEVKNAIYSDLKSRFGETTGACCLVASFKNGQIDNKAHTIDLEDLVERSKQQYQQFMNARNYYANTNNNFNQIHHNKPVHQYTVHDNQAFTLMNDQVHWQQQGNVYHNKNLNRKNNYTKRTKSPDEELYDSQSNDRFHWACKKSNITVSQA